MYLTLQTYFYQQQFRLSFGIHNWYSKLSTHTFQTRLLLSNISWFVLIYGFSFIELSLEEINAILESDKNAECTNEGSKKELTQVNIYK